MCLQAGGSDFSLNSALVTQTYNPSTGGWRQRQEDGLKFGANLSYIASHNTIYKTLF